MIKTKYWREYCSNDIDSKINNWLNDKPNIVVLDIKMKASGSYVYILILYKEGGKK